ncbi:isochorismatase family protein [Mycobacterium sp. 852002-51057_SCH5723018]|uniref:isochorismatase family protein n=1 Tax=Mycobacterium sp. 852002-51057_SCH5723018 TaxID=1834094 RepID=UPI0009ECF21B|nr:isochorismatase family protein [Mycobacterium sp. 852002-51057_SCH5723018]
MRHAADSLNRRPVIYYRTNENPRRAASPHKIVGPESNDLVLQLRKRGVNQVVLAGMAANLCVVGHLRELIEQGFEVADVQDATAGPRLPEGDGYLAALVNFRFLASAVWTTAEAVALLKQGG